MFHIIQDAYCIVRNKRGVYKQAKMYHYKLGLYVGVSGGYVRVMRNGDLGTPDLSYVEIYLPGEIETVCDNMGRLKFPGVLHG